MGKLEKVVRNPAPHKPKTDNAVPRSSNPQPTGTTVDGSSGAMGGTCLLYTSPRPRD